MTTPSQGLHGIVLLEVCDSTQPPFISGCDVEDLQNFLWFGQQSHSTEKKRTIGPSTGGLLQNSGSSGPVDGSSPGVASQGFVPYVCPTSQMPRRPRPPKSPVP